MKTKTAEFVADAYLKVGEELGVSVEDVLAQLLHAMVPSRYRRMGRKFQRADLVRTLKSSPEPTPEELSNALKTIGMLTQTPTAIRKLLKQRLKDLPRAKGGPPRKIRLEDEGQVCADIMALRGALDTREAIRRVGQRMGVSERTIYRIWGRHRPKKRRPPI